MERLACKGDMVLCALALNGHRRPNLLYLYLTYVQIILDFIKYNNGKTVVIIVILQIHTSLPLTGRQPNNSLATAANASLADQASALYEISELREQ